MPLFGIAFFARDDRARRSSSAAPAHRARARRCARSRSALIALQAFVDRRVVQAVPGRGSGGDRPRASRSSPAHARCAHAGARRAVAARRRCSSCSALGLWTHHGRRRPPKPRPRSCSREQQARRRHDRRVRRLRVPVLPRARQEARPRRSRRRTSPVRIVRKMVPLPSTPARRAGRDGVRARRRAGSRRRDGEGAVRRAARRR